MKILDLFGSYVTWRDYAIVITLCIAIFGISAYLYYRKKHQKDTKDWGVPARYLIALALFILALEVSATITYKNIQHNFDVAERYERDGDYVMALSIYMDTGYELGDYQDINERIARCKDKLRED